MTCAHPLIKSFTFSDGTTIQCCPDCTAFDKKRQEVLRQIAPTHHEYELWKYQPAVRKLVNRVLGRHRRHHCDDLVAHCYAELAARFYQYKGKVPVWAWAKQVLKGVTADWLDELIKCEKVVAESNGTDPETLVNLEKVWTGSAFESERTAVVKPTRPQGTSPDVDEELTEWAQGYVSFTEEVADDEEPTVKPEDTGLDVDVPPPTKTKIYCMGCAEVRKVLQQTDREEGENKYSTFTLECGHSREQSRQLKTQWKRKSRATGKPRGRPRKLNAAATL
jgi:hypothetical protein